MQEASMDVTFSVRYPKLNIFFNMVFYHVKEVEVVGIETYCGICAAFVYRALSDSTYELN